MDNLRAEIKFRNNVLWHKIHGKYSSVSDLSKNTGLSQVAVGELLNLKVSPLKANGEYSKMAKELAAHFTMIEEDLFPIELYTSDMESIVIEGNIASRAIDQRYDPESIAIKNETTALIEDRLSQLPERTRYVMERRFFYDETLQQISDALKVGKERIRQIENKGLKMLRADKNKKLWNAWMDAE